MRISTITSSAGFVGQLPDVDIVRVQDVDLIGASDVGVIAWVSRADRVLISHDASTMTVAAYARIARGAPMPGLIIVPQWFPVGDAIEDLVLVAECSEPSSL